LKAMKLRAERWRQNPAKDAERAAQLAPYVSAVVKAKGERASAAAETNAALQRVRWLVEEFRVSLFAQELGTAEPVSAVKLDRVLADLRGFGSAAASPAPAAERKTPSTPPASILPLATAKKAAPLKNLGALDKLFPR
jgi:ATP-dependent helicase HrpA